MKKWFIIIICVLVVGFGGYALFGSTTKAAQQGQAQVRTATVEKGTLNTSVSGVGTVSAVNDEDITSTIDNNSIAAVNVAAGQSVSKGETLITFTDGSTPIYAPIDGVITTVSVIPGQRVTSGEAVAHITNYNDLQTILAIDELDIAKLKVGQAVSITADAFPDQTFNGTVTAIADEGTATNGVSTFNVTVHIDNPGSLKVGMNTEGSIVTESRPNALYVPIEAVHESNNQKYVLEVTSDSGSQPVQTKKQIVQLGIANEDNVEITQGLTEGQIVELPKLAKSTPTKTTTSSAFGGMGGFGGMNGFGGMGGGSRGQYRSGGSGSGSFGGRSGN
jgi:HlyD family secretion protein